MSLPNLAVEQGQIWGMGVRHALFPVLTLGARLSAAASFRATEALFAMAPNG